MELSPTRKCWFSALDLRQNGLETPLLKLINQMTLGKSLTFQQAQFPHLENKDNRVKFHYLPPRVIVRKVFCKLWTLPSRRILLRIILLAQYLILSILYKSKFVFTINCCLLKIINNHHRTSCFLCLFKDFLRGKKSCREAVHALLSPLKMLRELPKVTVTEEQNQNLNTGLLRVRTSGISSTLCGLNPSMCWEGCLPARGSRECCHIA